ncbi:MAG: hypothetical protein RIC19_13185 [Phaeodactylibacter sp.]|uniref:hypothetical protein n=1 Tax=Phaeodactylibacter sp. TaxID=1940289 RepID=UPI0032EAC98A
MIKSRSLQGLLVVLFACLWQGATAQSLSFTEKDDVDLTQECATFCRPGVTNKSRGRGLLLERTMVGDQNLAPRPGGIEGANASEVDYIEQFRAKIKIPLINAPSLKVLAGYEYQQEAVQFERIGYFNQELFQSLNGKALRTNKYSLYINKSFNERVYGGLRLRTSYRGDYQQMMSFDPRYATFSGLAAVGFKERDDLEWGLGLMFGRNFFNTTLLPFGVFNQTFSDKWGIETVLPVQVMMRYNFTPTNMLLFGVEYQSSSYALDLLQPGTQGMTPYYFRHAEIALKAVYDKKIYSWIWLTAETGYLIPRRARFDNTIDAAYNFRARTSPQPFFRVGLFLSPPRDMIK